MASCEKTLESLANRLMEIDSLMERNGGVTPVITYEDTLKFVNSKKNSSTVSKTRSDVKKFREWLRTDGEERDIEVIPARELDIFLSRFLLTIRNTKTHKELEPGTIQGIVTSIRRYLVEKDYPEDLTTSGLFKHTRNTLKAKAKDLKEKGLGNRQHRSDPFTPAEIENLYQKGLLGGDNPRALIHTLWLNNTMHLGLRGRQEHTTMLWGDLELKKTNGTDVRMYIEFTERATKTRKGLNDDPRMFKPKLWEQKGDPSCPVALYLLYKEHRPTVEPDSRFYLQANKYWEAKGNWFNNSPMGKDSLGSIGKNLHESAGFSGKHTNHSGRKTFISNLLDKGVPPTEVAQISGHKNLQSLNHYHSLSIERQQELSDIIHAPQKQMTNDVNVKEREFSEEISESELVTCSQEVEKTLQNIEVYEEIQASQRVELGIVHSPGGSLSMSHFKNKPQSMFSGCTFNCPVNVIFKN